MLTGKQRRYLRGLGHHLEPVVQVGKDGITAGLVTATGAALLQHELIKVRVGEHGGDRHEVAEALAAATKSNLVGVVGRTLLLYREREEEPAIQLPD
jgi:RNA-binding protein